MDFLISSTIFILSFISSWKIINVALPNLNFFLWIAALVGAAANPNGIKMLLANGLSTFPVKGNPGFNGLSKSLSKNTSDCNNLHAIEFLIILH